MKDINGNDIDPIWAAEFRGFFFGDGYLGIITNGIGRKGVPIYGARVQITLRDDDSDIIKNIHSKLGGGITRENTGRVNLSNGKEHQSKPCIVWRVRKKEEIVRILAILDGGMMPSIKRQQIKMLKQFLDTVGYKPGPQSEKAKSDFIELTKKREELYSEMRMLHRYK